MNYNEAIEYIHGTHKFGRKLGLNNIAKLLELMGNPHRNLKYIHVAGTNGKGSTCSFITNILIEERYKVGFFSSPFLQVFNERIRLNGKNISDENLAIITTFVKEKVEIMLENGFDHPTEFEIVTAIAFEYYKREKVDIVVLEVGMGGRLDSTNVIEDPLCSVITTIALDHTEYLGSTISDIAYEKAGIIKDNRLVITYSQERKAEEVIESVAKEKNAKLMKVNFNSIKIIKESIAGTKFKYNGNIYSISLIGKHQIKNAILAINVVKELSKCNLLKVNEKNILKGLRNTRWPGRGEILSKNPLVIIDGAHNLQGVISLVDIIKHLLKNKRIIGVLGILEDKDIEGILKITIPLLDEIIVTEPNSNRKINYKKLIEQIEKYNKAASGFKKISEAINEAKKMANSDDVILIFGSLYMIGEVRSMFVEEKTDDNIR